MTDSTLTRMLTANLSTFLTGSLATLAIAGSMLVAELHPAWAQHAVVATGAEGPDGAGGQMFVLPAMPNRFDALTRPEFARRDVPLFREHLKLDESQMYVVEVLVDSYAEQFQSAVDQFREVQKRYRLKLPGMDGEMLGGHMLGGLGEMAHFDEHADEFTFDFGGDFTFAMESPGTVQIGVTRAATVSNDVEVTQDGDNPPQVMVSFVAEDENGESVLTEEQIKEITDRISERIKERLAEVEAKRAELEARRAAIEAKRAAGEDVPIQDFEPATAEEVARAGRALIAERDRLREELVTDVKLLLNEEQTSQWPAFERTQRRISTMRFAEFGGERVDVLRILNEQQPSVSDKPAYDAATAQYAIELDEALKARNAMLPEHEIETLLMTDEMVQRQTMGNEDRLKLMDKVADARAAVRDANLRAAETIEPLLAAEVRSEFHDTVMRSAYPHLYGATMTQRSLDAALELEGLDAETRTAIGAIADEYRMQLAAINERIADATRKTETRQHRRMIESMDRIREIEARREAGEAVDFSEFKMEDGIGELMGERMTLNKKFLDQLRGMLTEEQIAALPSLRRRNMPFVHHHLDGAPMGGTGVQVIRRESAPPAPPAPPPAPPAGATPGD